MFYWRRAQKMLWGGLLALLFLLTACQPTPTTPTPTTPPTATSSLFPAGQVTDFTPTPPPFALQNASPPANSILPLQPTLTLTFTRALDPASAQAVQMSAADGTLVRGEVTFPDAHTLRFTPQHPLQPDSTYTLTIAPTLTAADGAHLPAALHLTYTTETALAVTSVFPAEDSEDVPLDADITLVFNKPVAPLTSREQAPALPLFITPEIQGSGAWVNSAIYVFHPTHPLASNTTYTVILDTGVTDLSGQTLANPVIWQFTTHAVRVEHIQADNLYLPLNHDQPYDLSRLDAALEIWFEQPMDRESVARALSLEAPSRALVPPLTFRWNDDATKLTLIPQRHYALDTTYTLTITDEARAQDGGHLSQTVSARFHTVGWTDVLSPARGAHIQQDRYVPTTTIEFNTFLDADTLSGHIRVTPALPTLHWQVYGRYLEIGNLEGGTTYTITLLPGIADIYGHALRQPFTFKITTAHMEPSGELLLPAYPIVIEAQQDPSFWVRYVNIANAQFALFAVDDQDFIRAVAQFDDCRPNGPAVAAWSLPHVGDAPRDRVHLSTFHLSDLTQGAPLRPGVYCLTAHFSGATEDRTYWLLLSTDILTLQATPSSALVWATDWETGTPQTDLPITLVTPQTQSPSVLTISLPRQTNDEGVALWQNLTQAPRFALLHTADRFAITDAQWGHGNNDDLSASYWQIMNTRPARTVAYVYTDRPLYRPGQQINFKGLVRDEEDLHYRLPKTTHVWVSLWHDGKAIAHERLPLSAFGTFSGSLFLPDSAPVGTYTWRVQTAPDGPILGLSTLRVAAYHKPVFQVTLTPETPDLHPGEQTTVHLEATYYAGDAVGRAQVRWQTTVQPYTFQPPEAYQRYTFQKETNWWGIPAYTTPEHAIAQSGQTTTDPQGHAAIPLTADITDADQDTAFTVWATVTDAGGNSADSHTSVIVRQSDIYIGLKTSAWVGVAREPLGLDVVVLDPQGHPMPHHTLQIALNEERWHSVQRRGADGILRWESNLEQLPVQTFEDLTTDAQGKIHLALVPPHSGIYDIVAHTTDPNGRPREASLRIWVAGKEALLWEQSEHTLPLVPDQRDYHPGETAHLLAPQPFEQPTYGLLTIARGQIYDYRVFRFDQPNTYLDIPLQDTFAPVIYASVFSIRPPTAQQPADYRFGVVRLPVALDEQAIQITLTPDRTQLAPGETAHFTIETRDHTGQPVSAEVSLAVVDKAIYALAPDTLDLLGLLYPQRSLLMATSVGLTQDLAAFNARLQRWLPVGANAGSGGGEKGSDLGGVISLRENFQDTAYWRANIVTNAQGKAEVAVPLPDNMTTWVVTARAITQQTQVGQSQTEITVSQPFFVRLHTPAFFTAGDQVVIQAVLHNTTAQALEAAVQLKQAQGLTLQSPLTQHVTVPARGQATVRWRARVPFDASRVDLLVEADAGAYHDASRPVLTTLPQGGIPVHRFTTTEAVGTAGLLAQAGQVVEQVAIPAEAQAPVLRLNLAGSLTAGLAQSARLSPAPSNNCNFTLATDLLSTAGAWQAYQALDTTPQALTDLKNRILHDIQGLETAQTPSGGWGWCPQSDPDTFISAYAAYALLEAQNAGFTVDAGVLAQAADALQALSLPSRPTEEAHAALAFELFVAARLGSPQPSLAYALADQARARGMPMSGWAWLLQAAQTMNMGEDFIHPLVQRLENALSRSASAAHWDGEGTGLWHSDVATTALALDALLQSDPNLQRLAPVVRWLMANRENGTWRTPHDTSAAVLALTHWAQFSHETSPNYDYAIRFANQVALTGHMDATQAALPQTLTWQGNDLPQGRDLPLEIRRGEGPGVLYYDASLEIPLPAENLQALGTGLHVERAYYLLDDLQTPTTTVPLGATVQVRLTLIVPHDLHHVVLTDYLPAGMEPLDPNRTAPHDAPFLYHRDDFWRQGWGGWYFTHREAYDDRVVFVANDLPAGVYTLIYEARAAIPGTFQTPPAVAFETYFPDVRGRSAGALLTIR